MKWTDEQIKGKILHKLTRIGKFEHSHTAIENLQKGFPGELRGRVKDAVNDLVKEQIFHIKPTGYGKQISINTERKEKIMYYIDAFLRME
ncbi:hypothetical protein HYV81_06510 [Candidatus Woesearchaeota archaeon]|nr:hypothetical protein [Candidatus Woesearchaeota archaeon]